MEQEQKKPNRLFDEDLVKKVKIFRHLWDKSDKNFNNRTLRDKTWAVVAQNLGETGKISFRLSFF